MALLQSLFLLNRAKKLLSIICFDVTCYGQGSWTCVIIEFLRRRPTSPELAVFCAVFFKNCAEFSFLAVFYGNFCQHFPLYLVLKTLKNANSNTTRQTYFSVSKNKSIYKWLVFKTVVTYLICCELCFLRHCCSKKNNSYLALRKQ